MAQERTMERIKAEEKKHTQIKAEDKLDKKKLLRRWFYWNVSIQIECHYYDWDAWGIRMRVDIYGEAMCSILFLAP